MTPPLAALLPFAFAASIPASGPGDGPYQANGIKIGEVDQRGAIVWVRATRRREPRRDGPQFSSDLRDPWVSPFPEGRTLEDMRHATPGARGELRVVYWAQGERDSARATEWVPVGPQRDFTHQFALSDLEPGRAYHLRSEARASATAELGSVVAGRFRTASVADAARRVAFTVVTGQDFHRRDDEQSGHRIYPRMAALDPDFLVHTGDVVYYDKPGPLATTVELARHKWHRVYALPFQRAFHAGTACYFLKDDHDVLKNDCWPGQRYGELSFEDGLSIFREQTPAGELPYRTVRWGRDLQIWLLEGREFRSANSDRDGSHKTILGERQLGWLRRTIGASDATFRIVISPTPIVGPDRQSKNDNHANAGFRTEGALLRRFLADQERVVVVCGDRHWQYVSVDPETGLREFSCGPTSNAHAGGFPGEPRAMHRYLRIAGGFLSVTVARVAGEPTATFRHHDVAGEVRHEQVLR